MTRYEWEWKAVSDSALKAWGLWENGWRTTFDNRKKAFGGCNRRTKQIVLSKYFIKWLVYLNNTEEIRDTILHEIAHALAWTNHRCWDHGTLWKYWAIKVGARPKAKGQCDLPAEAYRWQLVDTRTGKFVRGWHRKPRNYPPSRIARMFLSGDPHSVGKLALVQKSA